MSCPGVVLMVDDNLDDLYLARAAILQAGRPYQVDAAFNGWEALKYLEKGPLPGLLVLDLMLPGMTGIDLLREIRARESLRYLPVVMMSGSTRIEDIKASYDQGANSFLHKALDVKVFNQQLQAAVDYWLTMNIVPTGGNQVAAGAKCSPSDH